MTQSLFTCSACGLLCTARSKIDARSIQQCPRASAVIQTRQSSLRTLSGETFDSPRALQVVADRIHRLLSTAQRPLVLIDGADVLTARKAIELAGMHSAVVFVPQSEGGRIVKRVEICDGWLGTTLADMAYHSELIISLGTRWQSQTPELASRWICRNFEQHAEPIAVPPNRRWWHLGEEPAWAGSSGSSNSLNDPGNVSHRSLTSCQGEGSARGPDQWLKLPKSFWHQLIANVTLRLRSTSTEIPGELQDGERTSSPMPLSRGSPLSQAEDVNFGERELAKAIQDSSNTTIVWETSELNGPSDEILVHRLWRLAQIRSQAARCNLLAISPDPGRETARQTLLWMTGCDSIAIPSDCGWKGSPTTVSERDSDWLSGFDAILFVRNTSAPDPRGQYNWNIGLCDPTLADGNSDAREVFPVGLIGFEESGFLMRGDGGMMQFVSPALSCSEELAHPAIARKASARHILVLACKRALDQTVKKHPAANLLFPGSQESNRGHGQRGSLP